MIGEEIVERWTSHDCVWVVDPIDGTTNFVNGFPMFAASIGVLRQGKPVVGAVWCSTSHAMRPGVYHASLGGKLRFEDTDVTPKIKAAGGTVCQKRKGKWEPVRAFSSEVPFGGGEPDLRFWRHPIVVGAPEAVERMCAS